MPWCVPRCLACVCVAYNMFALVNIILIRVPIKSNQFFSAASYYTSQRPISLTSLPLARHTHKSTFSMYVAYTIITGKSLYYVLYYALLSLSLLRVCCVCVFYSSGKRMARIAGKSSS